MKTDRYKDLELKFFNGEELSPEEEALLKTESNDPYFSFLKEEKQEKLNLSFDDFLAKAEPKNDIKETPIIPLVTAKPKLGTGLRTYWMAASLVMFMGLLGGYLFINEESGEINKPVKAVVKQDTEPQQLTQPTLEPQKEIATSPANETETKEPKVKEDRTLMAKEAHKKPNASPVIKDIKPTTNPQNQDYAYQPSYVIINGKPVYNEQEAISLTEDAFNYLASNVSQTVDHAQKAKNLSLDF